MDSDTTSKQKAQVWEEIQEAYTELLKYPNSTMYLDNLQRARQALRKCVHDRYEH